MQNRSGKKKPSLEVGIIRYFAKASSSSSSRGARATSSSSSRARDVATVQSVGGGSAMNFLPIISCVVSCLTFSFLSFPLLSFPLSCHPRYDLSPNPRICFSGIYDTFLINSGGGRDIFGSCDVEKSQGDIFLCGWVRVQHFGKDAKELAAHRQSRLAKAFLPPPSPLSLCI